MNKFIDFINKNLAPRLNKLANNLWLSALQDSIMTLLPFIFVGSTINLINNFSVFFKGMPDLSPIFEFTFGLLGLLISYMFPYNILKRKKITKFQTLGGFTGVGMYLMMCTTSIKDNTLTLFFPNLGAAGMFVSIILGVFISLVMMFFNKYSFFNEDNTALPEVVKIWFDALIPIAVCFVLGWIVAYPLKFNVFDIVQNLLAPLFSGSNTVWALIAIEFGLCFVYSFGISGWAIVPLIFPILLSNTAANVAAGGSAHLISSYEVILCAWLAIGGTGNTLSLNILMLLSKSKRIKAIGTAAIVPSIFNINEPINYGLPIALNPIMMIALWINAIVGSVITYVVLTAGIVPIPNVSFTMQFLPSPIETFIITNGSIRGPLFAVVMFIITGLIWYPFLKVYERNLLIEEQELSANEA